MSHDRTLCLTLTMVESHSCTFHFYNFNNMLSALLMVLEFNDTHFLYSLAPNYMPSISFGTKKHSYVPTAKGKMLDLFKDGRQCLYFMENLRNFFLSIKG